MKIAVLTLCLLGTLILAPRAALADASCAAERGDSDLDVLLSNENPFPAGGGGEDKIHLKVVFDRSGSARVHGVIVDGASNTVLVSENSIATVSCADVNANKIEGIAALQFVMRDVRTGDLVTVAISPLDGEIDESGIEELTLVIGSTTSDQPFRIGWRHEHTRPES